MFETTIAGSLPKPGWLAETDKLWPQWRAQGEDLARAKRDATLLWLKEQEVAGLDILTDGEQARQHFVHGVLEAVEGIDFEHKVKMGIRNNRYDVMVPVVVGPLKLKGRVHQFEARIARAHTKKKLKITMPGPMTIVDTIADRHYGDKVKLAMAFAELLNQEAKALVKDGVDVIQFALGPTSTDPMNFRSGSDHAYTRLSSRLEAQSADRSGSTSRPCMSPVWMPSAFCRQSGSGGGQSMSTTLRLFQSITHTALIPVAWANIRFGDPSGLASNAIGRTSWLSLPYWRYPVSSIPQTTVSVTGSMTWIVGSPGLSSPKLRPATT